MAPGLWVMPGCWVGQGRALLAYDELMPAHGNNPPKHCVTLPASPDERRMEAQVGGVIEPNKRSCGSGIVTAQGRTCYPCSLRRISLSTVYKWLEAIAAGLPAHSLYYLNAPAESAVR